MSLTMQCDKNAEGARDVSKQHGYPEGQVIVRTTHVGCVLETWERNGYDDSDFFALVWDEQNQRLETIEYGTTRGWTYANVATVDATPEVIAKAKEYKVQQLIGSFLANAQEEAKEVLRGRMCKVVKGRKIAKGEVVEVLGDAVGARYSMSRWASTTYTVLVRVVSTGNMVRTNVENLEVLNPENYFITREAAEAQARKAVAGSNWRSMGFLGMSKKLKQALARTNF